jgi:2-polyprenyl-3-methyl-5-hydroxy-6-metoxy-1,4-benzoquinol methylase
MPIKQSCKICDTTTATVLGNIEGYRANTFYNVMGCSICETNFVSPNEVDEKIYETIYKNVSVVPGYSRYLHYAQQILKENDPLNYLMSCEDAYWGIAQTILSSIKSSRSETLIWEIGCGQGYLTYALSKANFNAIGLDISKTAVESAKQRYGNFYFCEEAKELYIKTNERPSFIILSEVIEHLPDPKTFIAELMYYLKPGGALILTTPNKECCVPGVIWDTDLPPVHLWWFTAKGLSVISDKLSYQIEFMNLEEFYSEKVIFRKFISDKLYQRKPILDNKYNVIVKKDNKAWISQILKKITKLLLSRNMLKKIQLKMATRRGLVRQTGSPSATLVAIYRIDNC